MRLRFLSSRFVSSELPMPRYELATAGGLRAGAAEAWALGFAWASTWPGRASVVLNPLNRREVSEETWRADPHGAVRVLRGESR